MFQAKKKHILPEIRSILRRTDSLIQRPNKQQQNKQNLRKKNYQNRPVGSMHCTKYGYIP